MQLPNEIHTFIEDCEEHGYTPSYLQMKDLFLDRYPESQLDEWADELGLSELPQALPEHDQECVGAEIKYSYPEQELRELGLSWHEFVEID